MVARPLEPLFDGGGVQELANGGTEAVRNTIKGGHGNQPYGTSERIQGGEGFAGLRHWGTGSLKPWATPLGAPNNHNGQPVAQPGGLA